MVISPSESQGELQTSIVQDETETYLAGMDTKIADNKDDEYDLETHRMDGIYAPVYDSGYNVDFSQLSSGILTITITISQMGIM